MAARPPPDPNRSVDLKAAAAGRTAGGSAGGSTGRTAGGSAGGGSAGGATGGAAGGGDIQTDGAVMAKTAQAVTAAARGQMLPPNIQRGLPPINPASFSHFDYVPHFHQQHYHGTSANIFNITNSHNVQIGRTNVMNIGLPRQQYVDTSSSDEEDQILSIEDAKLEELKKCEREISNIELQDIAQHVGLGWRRLIRFLGMQDYDVDEVYEECGSRGLEEVIYQLLKRWKCEIPNPTVAEMLYQVQRCDMSHLAQYLRGDDFQMLN